MGWMLLILLFAVVAIIFNMAHDDEKPLRYCNYKQGSYHHILLQILDMTHTL